MKFLNISLIVFACFALVCLLSTNSVAANEVAGSKSNTPRRPAAIKSGKSTTTSAPPDYDNEYPDGENIDQYGDEGEETAKSSTTTTTEAPKKIGPVIRPFRSNDDFLNSLKRRQMDAKKHRAEKVAARSKPIEHHNNDTEEPESAPAPVAIKISKPSLPAVQGNRNRKFSKPGKPEPQEDTDAEGSEQQQEKQEEKLKRPHPRLALRKRA